MIKSYEMYLPTLLYPNYTKSYRGIIDEFHGAHTDRGFATFPSDNYHGLPMAIRITEVSIIFTDDWQHC